MNKTCISNTLRPAKDLLHVENKQLLTSVPDERVQPNCKSDSRLRLSTRKTTVCENTKTWKSYGKTGAAEFSSPTILGMKMPLPLCKAWFISRLLTSAQL